MPSGRRRATKKGSTWSGLRDDVAKTLDRLGVLALLPSDHRHVSRLEALQNAVGSSEASSELEDKVDPVID